MTKTLKPKFDNSLLAVNPAGPAPMIITSDSALSINTSCEIHQQ